MKRLRFKIVFTVLFILVAFILALPEFSFNFQNKEYTYPGIGFSRIGIPSDYGSFVKGSEIFPSSVYTVSLTLDENMSPEEKQEELSHIRDVVQARINYANLQDIDLKAKVNGDRYILEFDIAQSLENAESYVRWLTSNGRIIFTRGFSTDEASRVDLSDKDIRGNIAIDTIIYQTQPFQTLLLDFDDSKEDIILGLFSAQTSEEQQQNQLSMAIGGELSFILQPALDQTAQNYSATLLRALPLSVSDSQDAQNYLNIVRAYFQESEPLEIEMVLDTNIQSSSPLYNNDGGKVIIATFVIGLAALMVLTFRKLGANTTAFSILMLSSSMLLFAITLKFIRANFSYGTILGIIIGILIIYYFIVELLQSDQDEYKKTLANYRYSAIGLGLISMVLFKLGFEIGTFNDFLGTIIVASLVVIIVSYLNFKYIKEISLFGKNNKK